MALAKQSKCLTVDEVLERVTDRDLARWSAFYKLENEDHEKRMADAKAKAKR